MNRQEALNILGISETASEDDVKKRYRELTKKYHPDVNKDPGAEDHFKQINAAYSFITSPPVAPPQQRMPHVELWSIFNNFFTHQSQHKNLKETRVSIKITFEEAVKGCEKDITVTRNVVCDPCTGTGSVVSATADVCDECNGRGTVISKTPQLQYVRTCPKCLGRKANKQRCGTCAGMGYSSQQATCRVQIPDGVNDGAMLRLSGMGNFVRLGHTNQYLDAFLDVSVEHGNDMKIVGPDVVSTITIPLLDALRGAERTVQTVFGTKTIAIPAGSHHLDVVAVPGHGVRSKNGNHNFIINLQYPKNTDAIVELLEKETNV